MTKPLPLKVGDRVYCRRCGENRTVSAIEPDRYDPGEHGYAHDWDDERGNTKTTIYLPRESYRKLPYRKERPWTTHVFYVCSLTDEQCGESHPYGKSIPPSCEGCDIWMEPDEVPK